MPERKLNILYHFRVRGTGAEGVHIAGIVNGFRALGHNVRLVSPTNADPTKISPPETSPDRRVSIKRVILHKLADVLPQPFFEIMEFCYNFSAIITLWEELKSYDVDFIYERYAFFNLAGAFIAKRKNIPLIVEVNELSGHKRIRGQFFIRLCSAIERYVFRQAIVIVTVSDFLKQEVSGKVEKSKTKVVTIPNGVPMAWMKPKISLNEVTALREKYNLQDKKVICFVGGLVHWHNFDLLLQAVKETQEVVANVVMMFIGNGPLKKYIKDMAEGLGFEPDSILFVGEVPHSDIPLYLKIADVAVIPETNDFRSPIKMFEYMALGLPVVAPKKPAIKVAITNKREGLLFEPGDYSSLAQALLECFLEPNVANKLGENARQKVFNNFTWERHAGHILQLLSKVSDNDINQKK